MSEKLKPCPFCGGKAEDGGFWWHVIKCGNCGVKTGSYASWKEAVKAWNKRSLSANQHHADELFEAVGYVLLQLRLAFMGFNSADIDANKLQTLYDKIAEEERKK